MMISENPVIVAILFLCGLFCLVWLIKAHLEEGKAQEWLAHYRHTVDRQLNAWNMTLKCHKNVWSIHSTAHRERHTVEMPAVRMRKIIRQMENRRPTEVFDEIAITPWVKEEKINMEAAPKIGDFPYPSQKEDK